MSGRTNLTVRKTSRVYASHLRASLARFERKVNQPVADQGVEIPFQEFIYIWESELAKENMNDTSGGKLTKKSVMRRGTF